MKRNTKIIIGIILVIIIIISAFMFFKTNNQNNNSINSNESNISKDVISNEEKKYEYKAFMPTFYNTPNEIGANTYDFTHDMTYSNKIYYRKLNTYEEYKEVKARWNDIIDMTENDFETNFMVITAIENTSMLGLTVDNLEVDNNGLYISLIHYKDGENYNEKETCISYKK